MNIVGRIFGAINNAGSSGQTRSDSVDAREPSHFDESGSSSVRFRPRGFEVGGSSRRTSSTPKEERLPATFREETRIPRQSPDLKAEWEDGIVKNEVSTSVLPQTVTPIPVPVKKEDESDDKEPIRPKDESAKAVSVKIEYPTLSEPTDACASAMEHLEESLTTTQIYRAKIFMECLSSLPLKPHQIEGFLFLRGLEDGGLTGGILADDMGLGKTLQIIALFLADIFSADDSMYPSKSLVVVPCSIILQWASEIRRFAPKLNVHVHHGKTKIQDLNNSHFAAVDVVITTYDLVCNEYKAYVSVDDDKRHLCHAPLFQHQWWRVVLDEAQYIRNHKILKSIACCALPKIHGHCVTGTPAQNTIDDVYALVKFLRVPELENQQTFSNLISDPARMGRWYTAFRWLYHTLKPRLIRRTKLTKHNGKEIVKLESSESIYVPCHLTGKQKDGYHFIMEHYPAMEWTKYILYRLVCDHPILIHKFVSDRDADKDSVKKYLDEPLQSENSLDAEYMYKLPNLCDRCNASERALPSNASKTSLFIEASGKFTKALEIVNRVIHGNSDSEDPDKILVVSSFVKTLDLFEKVLEGVGVKFAKLNGSMSPSQRDQQLSRIKHNPEVTVFLLSFNAGGVGLNITSCNHLILLEPWWNPHAEDQVFGRIYRIGQKKNVFIYKLYAEDTIEHKILEVQEKKRKNIRGAFLGSCAPSIDSNEPGDQELQLVIDELDRIGRKYLDEESS
ncbi:hypothetical protein SCHPADRAFT_869237 [Schizopora paradoxa]|uniref:P-loop containing nucleoside triphosphate hydrolase protein n=1 Tax=Schizopora paradoxa TaxID=27342 RepID=A0A0H2RYA3_9AGAM|nr:hypothetical protein SCHPADRAFT_869237 [Schizopora paradoxa]